MNIRRFAFRYATLCVVLSWVALGCNSPDHDLDGSDTLPASEPTPVNPSASGPVAPAQPISAGGTPTFPTHAEIPSYRAAALKARDEGLEAIPLPGIVSNTPRDPHPLKPECNGSACPQGLVTIESLTFNAITFQEEKEQCSGFLISPDTVATARHCVPQDLQTAGASCTGRVWFFFPKTLGAPAEQHECSQVVSLSPMLGSIRKIPDYAFFRISGSVNRAPIKINRSGFQDGEIATFYHHVVRSKDQEKWVLERTQCPVAENTYFEPEFSRSNDARIYLSDCPIEPGDSGSAVFAPDGSVIGILDSKPIFNEADPEISSMFSLGLAKSPIALGAFGTSFACLPDPTDTRVSLPDDCEHFLHSDGLIQLNRAQEASLDVKLQDWQSKNEQVEWSTTRPISESLLGLVSPVPTCVKRDQLAAWTESGGVRTLELPLWSFKYSSSLQLTSETADLGSVKADLLYSADVLKSHGKTQLSLTADSTGTGSLPAGTFFIYNGELTICEDQ